jgi:hypothetical protein
MQARRNFIFVLAIVATQTACSNPGKEYQTAMCACRAIACVKATAQKFKDRLEHANPAAVASGAACATRLVAKETQRMREKVSGPNGI